MRFDFFRRSEPEKDAAEPQPLEEHAPAPVLRVDELLGQHQVVVKNLETNYRKVPGVAGATILGDGRVALIVDCGALVKRSRH